MSPTIERIESGPRAGQWLVMAYTSKRPYLDPDNPGQAIVPITALGGTARSRIGARLLARRLDRQVRR